ncbi:c-type cytochrome [Methylococcus capsulatus]|jgi:cytochrome c553|uniref:c-type cytochrome n=1 Tax=Methylococcus capsulatus TaxID=414 RepID=UPI002017F73C|nr:c-type cytochrome [Methylococcus capsulatus]UQN11819.1 cytochrome c4 [Methylococcus capsulatus]
MKTMTIKALAFGFGVLALGAGSWAHAEGNPAAGKKKAETCSGCHGEDGNSNAPIFPKLAGQHAAYLTKQLQEFRSQSRGESTMAAIAEPLSDEDIADLSAWFAKGAVHIEEEEGDYSAGERLYRSGDLGKGIPACSACHGPHGEGNGEAGFPAVRGQYSAYVAKALREFKTGERHNDRNQMMRDIAGKLSDEDIGAVSDFVSVLK